MSSPPASVSADLTAQAALARVTLGSGEVSEDVRFAMERDERQALRRLVDPGIIRNNDKSTAHASIDCLLKICENIINHPDEEKYQRFKTTNTTIKARIVEVKGGLEFAQAIGFRAKVENFQPFYHFTPTPKNKTSMRIGAFVLKEFQSTIVEKEEIERRAKQGEKAAANQAALKVKLAFEDDRKKRALYDQLAKERREAKAKLVIPTPIAPTSSKSPLEDLPGEGRTLSDSKVAPDDPEVEPGTT